MLLESIRYTGLPLWDSLDPSIGCSGWMQHVKEKLVNIGLKKVLKAPWFWNNHKSICKQILNHPVCEPYLRCLVCRLPSGLHRLSLSGLCRQLCDLINTLSFPSSAHVPRVFFGLSLIRTLGFDKVCLICGAEPILNQSVHKLLYCLFLFPFSAVVAWTTVHYSTVSWMGY